MIHYAKSNVGLVICLLVMQLCTNLFQTVKNALVMTQGRQALQLHYLWKELQLGRRPHNSYWPPKGHPASAQVRQEVITGKYAFFTLEFYLNRIAKYRRK